MTTFAEMVTETIVNTKRPELVSLTESAVMMATLRAHHVDFFPRDVGSSLLSYTVPTGNAFYVDIPTIFTTIPTLRTPDWIQGEDATTFVPNENLEHVVEFKNFWDENNCLRSSVFTLMGETLRVRFLSPTGRATFYYYKNPIVTSGGYSSWIADNHKEDLAKWAAAIVWMRSGFQEIAAQMQVTVKDFQALLVESYLSSKV